MGTLSEQLFKVGLISEKQFREGQAEEELKRGDQVKKQFSETLRIGPGICDELDKCATTREFKFKAKQILQLDPSQIGKIIQKAHRFSGDKKFIWFFYQIRDGLKDLSDESREGFLNKAFRKAGWSLEANNK